MTHTREKKKSPHCCNKETRPSSSAPPPKAKRGVLYAMWGSGDKHEKALERSMASVRAHHPELPIHVERFKDGGKINKIRICDLTPFEETAYLDNDTVVLGRLGYALDKATQFGLACCINECPWAKRYTDPVFSEDTIEYNCGILFFTKKAKPVFDAWARLFPKVDSSIIHRTGSRNHIVPVADQASFALAIEQTGFQPFVLPYNWNFRPQFYRSFFGPIKIWHAYHDVSEGLVNWNKEQNAEDALIRFCRLHWTSDTVPDDSLVEVHK